MSRSHGQKSCGRGCWVCGDDGEGRRAREGSWHEADDRAPIWYDESCGDYCDGSCSMCSSSDEFDAWLRSQDVYPAALRVPLGDAAELYRDERVLEDGTTVRCDEQGLIITHPDARPYSDTV